MVPSNVILDELQTLLATDATTLADPANALHVHLAVNGFTPGNALTVADFTEATFTGATALAAGLGAQQEFTDPATGDRCVQLLEPAGGWHWVCTAGTGLPQTVYGYYVTDNTDAVLYGCDRLDTPMVINATGQAVDIPYVRFAFVSPTME